MATDTLSLPGQENMLTLRGPARGLVSVASETQKVNNAVGMMSWSQNITNRLYAYIVPTAFSKTRTAYCLLPTFIAAKYFWRIIFCTGTFSILLSSQEMMSR